MKTKPLMLCENCGHKESEHNQNGCLHNLKLDALATLAALVALTAFAVAAFDALAALTAFAVGAFDTLAAVVAAVVAAVAAAGIIVVGRIICRCTETTEPKHRHQFRCECGKEAKK